LLEELGLATGSLIEKPAVQGNPDVSGNIREWKQALVKVQ